MDYEGRPWAPRRKHANVETEERRKALREDRGHTSREDRGHTSRNTWAYERSRTGLQQRSPTKTTNSNKGAQLRTTPGSKPRNSETKDSQSATWSSETKDSRSAAWNSETLDLHSLAEARESKDSGTCTACNRGTKGPERTGRQPSYQRGR